jgi:MATE family multidrug resistance protein
MSAPISLSATFERQPSAWGEARELIRLAAPISFASAGWALMGLVDTAVVGRAGAAVQAGVGLGNALYFALSCFGIGVMMGIEPLIAQAIGAGDEAKARRFYWQGLWLGLLTSAALAVPLALLPLVLKPLNVDAEVSRAAAGYLWWRLPSLVPHLLFFVARGYLQAVGRTRSLVLMTVVANVLNLGLDLLLVFGGASLPAWTGPLRAFPAMGAAGAALATSICCFVELAIVAWAVRGVKVAGFSRAPVRTDLLQSARVGTPIGLQLMAEVGVFSLAGVLAGRLGKESLAAHSIALNLASITFCAAIGFGSAGTVRVGKAIGALDTPAARRAGMLAIGGGAAFMAMAALMFWLVPQPLAALMTGEPEVARLAIALFGVTAVFQISDGIQGVSAGVLRGAGDTRITFVANLLGHYAVGLPVGILLSHGLGWGVIGLWWGLCAGLSGVAALLCWRFWRLTSREVKPL